MIVDVDEIIDVLKLKPFGSLGWLSNKEDCPFCGKKGKWGVRLTNSDGVFHCWRCSSKYPIKLFLQQLNLQHLCSSNYEKRDSYELKSIVTDEECNEEEVKEIDLPFGCAPLSNKDKYLVGRGFKEDHFIEFIPAYTNSGIEKRLNNYIIFSLFQKDKRVGWLARSRYSKEWHDEDLKKSKSEGRVPRLRYENSKCDFTKILGGYDTILSGLDELYIVEGIFDKIGLDNLLNVAQNKDKGVVFTFGKKISKHQIELIKELKPKKVILMFDGDAIEETRKTSFALQHYFDTYICYIDDLKVDPNDMSKEYFDKIMGKLYSPIEFSSNFFIKKLGS